MHHCEEFRERITEHIIDREDVSSQPEFQRELLICSSCSIVQPEVRLVSSARKNLAELSSNSTCWACCDRGCDCDPSSGDGSFSRFATLGALDDLGAGGDG